jgi:PAS domain S-box-containing protein
MISVLYVDDEASLLKLTKRYLEKAGFSVDTAESAHEALEKMRITSYDAVVSDYQMPVMDGIEFLKTLRASGNSTPFIIFTGKGREEVVIKAFEEGADFYLQKGGEPKAQFTELMHKIRSVVNRQRTEKLAKDTERRLHDIINFLPDATFAIDTEGKIIAWNHAIEEMTGVPSRDMLGKGNYEYSIPFYGMRRPVLIDLVSIPDEDLARDWYAIIRKEGDILIAETTLPRPLGRYSVLLGKASRLHNDEGDCIGAIESIRDITEQKRVEEELRRARDEHVNLLERMNDVYYRSDTEGQLILASGSWAKYLGYDDLSECIGKNIADTFYADPGERKTFLDEVYRNGSVSDYELTLKKKDGTLLPVATSSYLYFDESGTVLGVEGTWRDITDRKRAEEALRIQHTLALDLTRCRTLTEAVELVLDAALHGENLDSGGIYLAEPVTGALDIVVHRGLSAGFVEHTSHFDADSPQVLRVKAGIPFYGRYTDIRQPGKDTIRDQENLASLASIPVLNGGNLVAIMNLASHVHDTIPTHTRQLLETLAAQMGSILVSIRSEEAFHDSKRRYHEFFNVSRDSVFIASPEGRWIDFNDALVEMFGYESREEMSEVPVSLIFENPGDWSAFIGLIERDGYIKEYPLRLQQKDGAVFDTLITASLVRNPDRSPKSLIGTIRDVTAWKRAEQELQQKLDEIVTGQRLLKASEEKYRTVFENTGTAMVVLEESGIISLANEEFAQLSGYSKDAVEGKKKWTEFVMEDDVEWMLAQSRLRMQHREEALTRYEFRFVTKSGSLRTIYLSIGVIPGTKKRVASLLDITRRKQEEEMLFESQRRLTDIIDFLPDATFVIDKDKRVFAWNRAIEQMTGIPKKDIIGKGNYAYALPFYETPIPILIDSIFSGDDNIDSRYKNVRREGNIITAEVFVSSMRGGGGAYIWATASALYDDAGTIIGAIESIRDITDRKMIEETIRQSEEKFRTLLEKIPDMVLVHRNGKILYVNPAMIKTLGFTPDDIKNKSIIDYIAPEYRDLVVASMQKRNTAQYPEPYEIEIQSKNGELRRVIVRGALIEYEGSPAVLNVLTDITERKRADENLRESEERYSALFDRNYSISLLIDPDTGRIVDANDAACRYYGFSRDQLLERGIYDLNRLPPEKVIPNLIRAKNEREKHFSSTHYLSDGEKRDVEVYSGPITVHGRPLFYSIIHDITDRKQIEQSLRESEQRYHNIIEDQTEFICRFTPEGRHVFINDAYARYFGKRRQDLMGKIFHPNIFPDDRERVRQFFATLTPAHPVDYIQHRIIMPDGEVRWQRWSDRAIFDADGSVIEYQSVGRDVTIQKRIEEALHLANTKLNLLSSITRHDIYNQLGVLDGYLDMLHDEIPDPDKSDYFAQIANASSMIGSIIRFTKEYEQIGVHLPVWQEIRSRVAAAGSTIDMGGITLVNHLPAGLEVNADPMIVKVFFNLLDNSIRHGQHVTEIRVACRESDDALTITWEDNGIGIPDKEKSLIFKRGYGKNTGLGLFLVQEILSINEISITENGESGKGARFEISVPKGRYRFNGAQEK